MWPAVVPWWARPLAGSLYRASLQAPPECRLLEWAKFIPTAVIPSQRKRWAGCEMTVMES